MLALTVAFTTAALALIAKIASDWIQRHYDRQGIAAALAGEIGAYLNLLEPNKLAHAFRLWASMCRDARVEHMRAIPPLPTTHPVFDSASGKLGLLPVEDAQAVSEIYNVVTGLRLFLTAMSLKQFHELPDDVQIVKMNVMADLIDRRYPAAIALLERLRAVSEQSAWSKFIAKSRALPGAIPRRSTNPN